MENGEQNLDSPNFPEDRRALRPTKCQLECSPRQKIYTRYLLDPEVQWG